MVQWKLLFVDDSDLDVMLAVRAIRAEGRELSYARVDTAPAFAARLAEERWDAVICDHQMPEFDALSALRQLNRSGHDIPLIIVSGVIPDEVAITAMREGARDFVAKDRLNRLPPAIARELGEARNRAQLRQAQASIDRLLHHDMLTGVANADALMACLSRACETGAKGAPFALGLIDLNRFRKLSQGLGMVATNRLLRTLAMRLSPLGNHGGLVARIGTDRFGLFLPGVSDEATLEAIFGRIRSLVGQPVEVGDHQFRLTCCIGAALSPRHAADAGELLQFAEAALDAARHAGYGQARVFSPGMGEASRYQLVMESALYRALSQREFELHYQPQVDIASRRVIGVEALLRWRHPERGLILPGDFVPLLEDTGLILGVGEWVIAEAARQWVEWRAAGLPPLRMAINLSTLQFQQSEFAELVARLFRAAGADLRWFEFEITENVTMGNEEQVLVTLSQLKALGVTLAIDDFGTGYSSLAYLQQFPVDRLKIDQSFVRGGASGASIARAIVALAHSLGLEVIAEGVETAEQAAALRGFGCSEAQGYLYARPMAAEFVPDYLRQPSPAGAP